MEKPFFNILYIDDEISNLTGFKATFRRDFNVFTANSGLEGIAILKQYPIHIVLADQRMPDMSGIQFFEAISADYPDIIRMILTGFTDVETMIEAINLGKVYRYITKPWNEKELRVNLDSASKAYLTGKQNREKINELQERINELQNIISLYKMYTPPHIEADILNTANLDLADGQVRVVSLLFIDIANFFPFIEELEPPKALILFNSYLKFIEDIVLKNHGYINKSENGKLEILFGAPVSFIDNPLNAINCALEITKEINSFNIKNNTLFEISIAINFGDIMTGSTHLHNKIEYTTIGNNIRITENLLKTAKSNNQFILITKSMYDSIKQYNLQLDISEEKNVLIDGEDLPFYAVTPH